MSTTAIWIDGRVADAVSALDRGLHYGDGLFETIACSGGRAQLLPLHLARLRRGCERLDLPVPAEQTLRREIDAALEAEPEAVLKLILTRGSAAGRGYAYPPGQPARRLLLRYPRSAPDPAAAVAGVRVRLGRLRLGENPALAGIKHLNRLEQVLARRECSDAAIAESLLFSAGGALVSGTMSNVFLVRAGALATPRLERCGVEGVMRATVAQLAVAAGIDCREAQLGPDDLAQAEEIFLTNALIGIHPVRELAGRELSVGPRTQQLQRRLAQHLATEAGRG
ncbi:MAG TPA: aminodeoxychorismate lyase [Steroidobacteraceae bacterium]|nr:aminodeoxychorismate lyase [Steroidobacteraceae bacterium]